MPKSIDWWWYLLDYLKRKSKWHIKKQRRQEPSVAELTKSLVSTDESDENPKMKYMYIGHSDEDSDSDGDCDD